METETGIWTNQQVTLLSETDRFGTILFANEAFSKISKFSPAELIHKPHNIIRHPDMPKELFKCLWDTIQRGDVFRGVIKNLAKDGSPYWVNATIMPFKERGGEISKYVGVRYLIPDEKVAQSLFDEQMKERMERRL
jgi:PAS domain S-box-containing protein